MGWCCCSATSPWSRGRLRYVVPAGVAIGLRFLAGHPEEWLYTPFFGPCKSSSGPSAAAWPAGRGERWPAPCGWAAAWSPSCCCSAGSCSQPCRCSGSTSAPAPPSPTASAAQIGVASNALLPDFGYVQVGENVSSSVWSGGGTAALGVAAGRRDLRWLRVGMASAGGGQFPPPPSATRRQSTGPPRTGSAWSASCGCRSAGCCCHTSASPSAPPSASRCCCTTTQGRWRDGRRGGPRPGRAGWVLRMSCSPPTSPTRATDRAVGAARRSR